MYTPEDAVIVNIWTSEKNKRLPGANVGHVSIETHQKYMSLWPAFGVRKITEYFESRPKKFFMQYVMDCITEGRAEGHCRVINDYNEKHPNETVIIYNTRNKETTIIDGHQLAIPEEGIMLAVVPCYPTVRIALYSLDKGKVHNKFEELKQNISGWSMVGSNVLTRTLADTPTENCASFAYRLLQAGGFQSLLVSAVDRSSLSSDASSLVNPDMFVPYLRKAKEQELAKVVIASNNWHVDGETSLQTLQTAYESKSTANVTKEDAAKAPGCLIL